MDILNTLWSGRFGQFNQDDISYIFDPELAAIYLAANLANHQQLLALDSYPAKDTYSLQKAQHSAIASICAGLLDTEQIKYYLRALSALNPSDISQALDELPSAAMQPQPSSLNSAEELANAAILLLEPSIAMRAQERCDELLAGAYSMAFAGCFNAGKSSLINAVLSTDALKASNAPETAAISVISHANEPCAELIAYDDAEYRAICEQSALSKEAANWLNQPCDSLLPAGKISLDELANIATASNPLSRRIKQVNLQLNAPLLASGARLIDTPGLDDIIISREQASRKFLASADEIFYLCSSTQALSSKDCEFLCEFFKRHSRVKLSIVLTKSDLINCDEIAELCAYAKEKLSEEFNACGLQKSFEVFCLSAASKAGMQRFCGYLNAQIASKDKLLANALLAAISAFVDEQINMLKQRQNEQKQAQIASEAEQAKMREQICEANEQINAQIAALNELLNRLNQKDFNPANDRYLLAKRIAASASAEFEYSKNYSTKMAQNAAAQAFKDYCAGVLASNLRFIAQLLESAKAAREDAAILSSAKMQEQIAALSDDFSAAIERFEVFNSKDEQQILAKLEAILNNLDLALIECKSEQEAAKKQLKAAISKLLVMIKKPPEAAAECENYDEKLEQLLALKESMGNMNV